MANEPGVCCVMLTRDRPEFARRAVECFRASTYDPARRFLLIWDTGDPSWYDRRADSENEQQWTPQGAQGATIGALRNAANNSAGPCDIFIHLDSDDWSHPNRITEQVALLQSSGAECVGYREMLFWRDCARRDEDGHCVVCGCGWEDPRESVEHHHCPPGFEQQAAWLYTDAYRPVGTSFCYWRRTWEQYPFPDLPQPNREPNPDLRGEDVEWLRGVKYRAVHSIVSYPRMIARIHDGNSSGSYVGIENTPHNWRRVPEWDTYCRERMTL